MLKTPHLRARTDRNPDCTIRGQAAPDPEMPDDTLPSSTPSAPDSTPATARSFRFDLTLSRVQPVIGTMAGLVSVIGAAFSVVQFARPADTGELVAIVQAAEPRRTVSDATIEVLTAQDAIVATLTPDPSGQATKELPEGVYVVRVRHPRYAAEVRRVQVLPRQSVEVRATLRAAAATPGSAATRGSSSPIERAVGGGVNAVRKVFRF
jgi:hypothetical protein